MTLEDFILTESKDGPEKNVRQVEETTAPVNHEPVGPVGPSSGRSNHVGEVLPFKVETPKSKSEDIASSMDLDALKDENPKTSSDSGENATERGGVRGGGGGNSAACSCFLKLSVDNKMSDMELDHGAVDPLEVARQVALEVGREVDSREQSCSTSERSDGPESQSRARPVGWPGPAVSSRPGPFLPPSTPPVSEVAQESDAHTEQGFSRFDLNREFCFDDVNPISSVISVVSASMAAAATGPPDAPLRLFEGALGWKGSAATSAFRRFPESDRAFSSSGNYGNGNSKKRSDRLDIDLNVVGAVEEDGNKPPVTTGLRSAEGSCIEAGPVRSERPLLDLNSLADGAGELVSGWNRTGPNRNGPQSPSRSSSSSSMQPAWRNIDLNLNDQPVFEHLTGSNTLKRDVFGTEFGREIVPWPPGPVSEPVNSMTPHAGPGHYVGPQLHPHPLPYGHTGFVCGPAMLFSPGGPVPYMVDSRGVYVVPQIMGPTPTPPFAFSQPPPPPPPPPPQPFMALAGGSHFDLNSGSMVEGGNRDNGAGPGPRHYLWANNGSQAPSGYGGGGGWKRQEPGGGLELFPVNKHHQSPWN